MMYLILFFEVFLILAVISLLMLFWVAFKKYLVVLQCVHNLWTFIPISVSFVLRNVLV